MNFNLQRRDDEEISITPLIDVVFILLIFFMVTTTFERESRIAVNLPEAAEQPVDTTAQPREIIIDESGIFYINGNALSDQRFNTLLSSIKDMAQGDKETPIVIRADARTPYQSVVAVMDATSQLGLFKVSLATNQSNQ